MNPRRQFGFPTATALVVSMMIGTGIFTTSGLLLTELGSPWVVLAVWAVGGIIAALGSLCYGALARRIPESGGEYLFLSRTLHPSAGCVAGWISLIAGFSAPLASSAFALGEYLKAWLPGVAPQWPGTAVILLFAALHAAHVRRGASVHNTVVVVELIVALAFIAVALPRLHFTGVTASAAALPAYGPALVWVSFSYAGWNTAAYVGGEVRNPERNLPRAMLAGTALVTVLYLALNAAFLFCAPPEQLAGKVEIGRVAAEALGGKSLADTITVLVLLALLTSVSSLTVAGPRVTAKMADDGCLPRRFAAADGPPRAAIAAQAILALLMLWTATFDGLLTYIGFTLGLSTAATTVGLMRLRGREGKALPVAGWPWVPWLFVASVGLTTALSVIRRPKESVLGLGTIAIGWLAWWLTARRAAPYAQ